MKWFSLTPDESLTYSKNSHLLSKNEVSLNEKYQVYITIRNLVYMWVIILLKLKWVYVLNEWWKIINIGIIKVITTQWNDTG